MLQGVMIYGIGMWIVKLSYRVKVSLKKTHLLVILFLLCFLLSWSIWFNLDQFFLSFDHYVWRWVLFAAFLILTLAVNLLMFRDFRLQLANPFEDKGAIKFAIYYQSICFVTAGVLYWAI